MDTRCSARARAIQTIGQFSAIRWVRAMGMAWAAHSASSAANSQEVARLFTGFSISVVWPAAKTSHQRTYLLSFKMWYPELSEGSLAISAKDSFASMLPLSTK